MKILYYLLLIVLLFTGAYLNFMPHLNYGFPLHVDEWTHFTASKHISQGTPLYFGGESESLEQGFHLFLAVLNSVGIDYLLIFKFLPALMTMLISMAIFIVVRKYFDEVSALVSVLFFILLNSSTALLGSMFLVPLSYGLLLIPISLFLIKSRFLFVFVASTLIAHPPSGIALLFLIGSYFLAKLFKEKKISYSIIIQSLIGIVLSLPLFLTQLTRSGLENLEFRQSIIPFVFIPRFFGVVITVLIVIGIYVSLVKKKYIFFIYTASLLVLAVLYYRLGVNVLIMYERNLMYIFESFALVFGVGVVYLSGFFKKYKSIALIVILLLVLILMVPEKIESTNKVYHIINETEYEDFLSYRDVEGDKAVLHPWKAIAFTPIAEKEIYSRIPPGPIKKYLDRNNEIFEFFNQSCKDESFLRENKIDIVVGC